MALLSSVGNGHKQNLYALKVMYKRIRDEAPARNPPMPPSIGTSPVLACIHGTQHAVEASLSRFMLGFLGDSRSWWLVACGEAVARMPPTITAEGKFASRI